MGRSSVFSLEQIYRKQVTQTWSKIPEVFRYVNSLGGSSPAGTDFGYFMGGSAECCPYLAPFSTVDRLDFSNDTDNMVAKAALTTAKAYMRGFSSFTHGYTAGGYAPAVSAVVSTIDRIDYASDTTAQTAKGPLETAVSSNNVGLHNTDYGYSVGGYDPSTSAVVSLNQRLEFANDTTTTAPKGNLGTAKFYGAGAGNQSYGYYSGGGTPSRISSVERLDYSSDTTTLAPKGPLSRVVNEHDAAGNADYGYHAGGWDPGSPYATTNDRIDYSNDTATALVRGILGYPGRHGPTATGNTSYGYWTGGYGNTTNSYRLDYSSDTTTMSVKGKRTTFSQNGAGVSSRANAMPLTSSTNIVPATRTESFTSAVGTDFGYFGGRSSNGPRHSEVQRIDFTNDTATASARASLDRSQYRASATGNQSFGYWAGGRDPSAYPVSKVSRVDYSNDQTAPTPKGPLSATQDYAAATGTISYGYHAGGRGGSPSTNYSRVERIDYGNDTATSTVKGPLTLARIFLSAVGNQSYGYFAGGDAPGTRSTVDRIDYSNDTANAVAKGPVSSAKFNMSGGTGNADYGYYAGYSYNYSTVDRIDYSNDTATAAVKGPRSINGTALPGGGTGNQSYGYTGGGYPGATNTYVDRIDYANDTATASPKGNLAVGGQLGGAASSRASAMPLTSTISKTMDKGADGYTTSSLGPAYGYNAGGAFPGTTSTVQRIDYGNDTATTAIKSALQVPVYGARGAGNDSYGYIGGGAVPHKSSVDRIDYANDASAPSMKGNFNIVRKRSGSVSNTTHGYWAGGDLYSSIDRITFASDTSTATPKGNMTESRYILGASGNANYGWISGGYNDPNIRSTIHRIDYSNDTGASLTGGTLSNPLGRYQGGSQTGNANYGWYGGDNAYSSYVQRIDYSNDGVTTSPKGSLTSGRGYLAATGSPSFGYFIGGEPGAKTTIDRLDYSSDTTNTSPKGNLDTGKYWSAAASAQANAVTGPSTFIPRIRWVDSLSEGVSPEGNNGYFGAGAYNPRTIVDRVDFSNDTATATPKGNLSSARYKCAGIGNKDFGYFGGGVTTSPSYSTNITTVDRLDYANDSADMVAKGPLANAHRANDHCVGNNDYGYWCGSVGRSYVDRIDYSSDTSTTVQKGSLSINRAGAMGAGDASYGYICGGETPSRVSSIDRIDFSSDTSTAAPKGNLTNTVDNGAATGNASYGYIGGGSTPSPVSTVDRIDYSNDTATASPKGPLIRTNWLFSATGNTSFGYFGGGDPPSSPSPAGSSFVDRVDYSNDTPTMSSKGNLSVPYRNTNSFSPREYALPTVTIAAPVQPPFPYPVQSPRPAMSLTLESSDSSRLGDTTSVINTWWGTQTYDTSIVTNVGEQSYQGFYAFTTGKACTITATLGGAAGWSNSRGRSITATFSVSAGTRIVFFAGKPTEKYTSGQEVGAAGGASCLMVYDTSATGDDDYVNGFYPLIIAAGGSAAGNNPGTKGESNFRTIEAVPLTTTTDYTQSNLVAFRKASGNSSVPAPSPGSQSDFDGGWGRNGTQSGGAGWKYAAIGYDGNVADSGNAVSLAYGATGMLAQGPAGAAGGFGGGGGDKDGNFYGAGGGGYYGGFESSGGHNTGSSYYTYGGDTNGGNSYDDRGGPLSFVHSSGTSVTDNGLHGETSSWNDNDNANQIKGRVHLVIREA